jgi:hypothetical protein
MRGVHGFAVVSSAVLVGLAPVEAMARETVAALSEQAPPVASLTMRAAGAAVLLLGTGLGFWWMFRREAALGRAAPPKSASEVDAEWLSRHVFSLPPELVGAAYGRRIAAPEVAAVLARMHAESKLASRVAAGSRGWNNLELWLLVERDELTGYERELVDSLFVGGKTTSGDRLQERYRTSGFEPAEVLRRHLDEPRDALLGIRPAFRWPLRVALAASGVSVLVTMLTSASGIIPVVLAIVLGALGPLWGACVFAPRWRRDLESVASRAWPCIASTGASVSLLALLVLAWPSLPPAGVLGISAWGLMGVVMVVRAAASRESQAGYELRRNLLAARGFFAAELGRPEPRIHDEWLPYLIALDLTRDVAHWYLVFGRLETTARKERLARGGADEDPAANAATWTGGAGALGGVGECGAWIAATSGLRVVASDEQRELGTGWGQGFELRHV